MAHHKIKYSCQCGSCKGTGLYVGFAESSGAAVVCHVCKGTGEYKGVLEYDDFEGRKRRKDIKRVYRTNPGIGIGEGTNKDTGETFKLEDFGGIPYKDWLQTGEFPPGSENRRFTCPAWWYQCSDYKRKPEWEECLTIGSFSQCPHFKNKDKCWQRFDKEGL